MELIHALCYYIGTRLHARSENDNIFNRVAGGRAHIRSEPYGKTKKFGKR